MSKNKDYQKQADDAIEALKSMIQNLIALPEEAELEDRIEQTLADLEQLRAKVENHSKGYEKNNQTDS